MASPSKVTVVMGMALLLLLFSIANTAVSTWCVVRSDASDEALQTALDYACWAGADCSPILSTGLCFLPNTIQAHASYAFNSYYQRKAMAAGSCDFSGTATIAKTDPSYGSCVYPASQSTAGGSVTPGGTGTNTPTTMPVNAPPPPLGTTTPIYGNGGLNPGLGPVLPNTQDSKASLEISILTILTPTVTFFHVYWFIFQAM